MNLCEIYHILDNFRYKNNHAYLHVGKKSSRIMHTPFSTPKSDQKKNLLVVQEFHMSRYHAETYQRTILVETWIRNNYNIKYLGCK